MMRKKLAALIVLFVVTGITASAFAADLQWFGGAHDRDWFNTANWGPAGGPIPTSADKAKLNFVWANPGPIVSAPGAIANEIFISEDMDLGTMGEQSLTVATGGILTANGQVLLGYNGADARTGFTGNQGRLVMDGGTANLVSHLFVGFTGTGNLQVDAGTLNVAGMFGLGWNGGQGNVNISGGLLHTEAWNFTNNALTTYTFNFSELRTGLGDGEWVQNHFWKNEIQALVNAGKITTSVAGAHVQVDWDPVLEQTHVYAIPEPVSIVLLGLGALCLRRKQA
jgi:hypothetical protein